MWWDVVIYITHTHNLRIPTPTIYGGGQKKTPSEEGAKLKNEDGISYFLFFFLFAFAIAAPLRLLAVRVVTFKLLFAFVPPLERGLLWSTSLPSPFFEAALLSKDTSSFVTLGAFSYRFLRTPILLVVLLVIFFTVRSHVYILVLRDM